MIEPIRILHAIARFQRSVVDELEQALGDAAADPEFRGAYEAELGLAPGALDKASAPARPRAVDVYADDEAAGFEEFMNGVDDMVRYVGAWRAVLEAAAAEDTSRVVDELMYRAFELATLNHVKYRRPWLYWSMRLVGVLAIETRVHVFETLRLDRIGDSLSDTGAYFENLYFDIWEAAAPPPPVDPCPRDDGEVPPENPHTSAYLRHWSDAIGTPLGFAPFFGVVRRYVSAVYGWEPSPDSETPLGDEISDRALTVAFTVAQEEDEKQGAPAQAGRAVLTFLAFPDATGRFGGLFLAVRGDLKFDHTLGGPDEPDPWRLTTRMFAPDGGELLIGDGVQVFGDPTLAVEVSLKRVQGATPAAVLELLGTRVELGALSFGLEIGAEKSGVKARAEKSALVIAPADGDAFLAKALTSKELRLNFDLGVGLDTVRGLHLEGGAGLTATLPIAQARGPVNVQSIHLSVAPGNGAIDTRVLASVSARLGAFTFSVDRIGFRFGLGFGERGAGVPEDGITLLPSVFLDGKPGFEPPVGIGVAIDCGVVKGGGSLFYDAANGQYAAVLEIRFKCWTLKAIGLLSPAPAGSSIPFSLLLVISGEDFPPWEIGLGVRITAIGGLVGLNHGSDVDALRAGVRNRALDSVLFPEDPVANAPRIVGNLRSLFPPAADQFLFGLMARFEWPKNTLFTGELGLILELDSPWRVIVLGQLRGRIPFPEQAPVKVNIDALGVLDLETDEFSLDATLYDSRVIGFTLTGDGALRIGRGATGDQDTSFLCSLGGFHPRFTPPAGFPKLQRLAIHFGEGDTLRMRSESYLAISSNTLQFGARVDLYAGFAGFSLEGALAFDVLFQSRPPELVALLEGGIAFKWRGMSLLGVWLEMTLSGFRPWHVEGKVTFEVFGFSKSKSVDETFGEDAAPPAVPEVDPLPELVAALRDPRNWQSELPGEREMLVTLRRRPADDGVRVHPLGRAGVRQRVVPLDVELDHLGGARLRGARRFSVRVVSVDGRPAPDAAPLTDLFAPAQILTLTDDEKLSRPSFEPFGAGIALGGGGLSFGRPEQAAVADADYETCIMDANGRCAGRAPHRLDAAAVGRLAATGPAANSALRRTGAAPERDVRVEPATFAVAATADLSPTGVFATYTAAAQALGRRRPPGLQVVGAFETEDAA